MNGLSELNTFGSQSVTVSDSRKAAIVFESQRNQTSSEISFANGVFTFKITKDVYPFEIEEIINYQTCLPKLYITIRPNTITGSTLTQSLIAPVERSNPTSNLEYVLSGYTNHMDWSNNLEFTWNLPSNIANLRLLFLTFRLVWLDQATGLNKEITWDVYDIDYYYLAAFESNFNLESNAIRIVSGESNLVSKFVTGSTQAQANLVTVISATCNASAIYSASTAVTMSSIFNVFPSVDVKSQMITTSVLSATASRPPFKVQVASYSGPQGNRTILEWTIIPKVSANQVWIIDYGYGQTQTFTGNTRQTIVKGLFGTHTISIYDDKGGSIDVDIAWTDSAKTDTPWLRKIISWGGTSDYSNNLFNNFCENEIQLTNIPDFCPGNNLTNLFRGAYSLNDPNISKWDTSNVTSMNSMFAGAYSFNQPIGNWNVSNVRDMTRMFESAREFNQPLTNWNVSNVRAMGYMFYQAFRFNQPLNTWNVINVQNMENMFRAATVFNQPLSNWIVGNVENMGGMFLEATQFNQPIGNWNVSKVNNMSFMFNRATNFKQPLNNWAVGNVINMESMFRSGNFNQPLSNWNTSKVTNMISMFQNNNQFDQNISNWKVTQIPTAPSNFATGTPSTWTLAEKPRWGV
jgi:surface protein